MSRIGKHVFMKMSEIRQFQVVLFMLLFITSLITDIKMLP